MHTKKEKVTSRKTRWGFRLVKGTILALLGLGTITPLSHTLPGETSLVKAAENDLYGSQFNQEAIDARGGYDIIYVKRLTSAMDTTLTEEDLNAMLGLYLKYMVFYIRNTTTRVNITDVATVTVSDSTAELGRSSAKITLTYSDGSISIGYWGVDYYLVPDAPVIETDLTGMAGSMTPVTIALTNVAQAATVYLYDNDGNIIGSAEVEAGATNVTITPTTAIPAGNVTARVIYTDYLDDTFSTVLYSSLQPDTDRSLYYSDEYTVVATSPATDDNTNKTTDSSTDTTTSSDVASTKEVVLPATGEQTSLLALVTGLLLAGGTLLLLTRRKKDGE